MLDSWWRLLGVTPNFSLIIALLFTRHLYHYRRHCCHHFLRRTYLLKFPSARLRLWTVKFFIVFICFFLCMGYRILSVSWSFTFLRLLHWPKVYIPCKRIVAGASQKFTVNGNKNNKKTSDLCMEKFRLGYSDRLWCNIVARGVRSREFATGDKRGGLGSPSRVQGQSPGGESGTNDNFQLWWGTCTHVPFSYATGSGYILATHQLCWRARVSLMHLTCFSALLFWFLSLSWK